VTAIGPGADRARRSPGWASVRLRLSLLYSAVVFGLAAVLVAAVYLALRASLDEPTVSRERVALIEGGETGPCVMILDTRICGQQYQPTLVRDVQDVERDVNRRALERFRMFSFLGLGGLFGVSLGVGWVVAGRVLRPIERITEVARDIQATDLSRRIRLEGPDDELKHLADTFDEMLGRVETAFEDQRSFIHEASHELRNPIAVIRTNVEVAVSDPHASTEDLRDTLTVVGRAAERMGVLVDDLLMYARQEAPAVRETVVDVGRLVAESVAEFSAPAEARHVRLSWSAGEGLDVHGDPVALKQALANLLANAVRLAPSDSDVRVAAGREDSWVWMAVQDQGPGIPEADQPKVFERFYRGNPAQARAEGRSGLGLTIVRQIARGHGGSVGLRSTVGVGSTFSVWLPAYSPGPATAPAGASEETLVDRPSSPSTANA
jgi:signal transduction histidine kinase